jgi:hypothetical protein
MISRETYNFVRDLFGPFTAALLGDFAGGVMDPPRPQRIRDARPPRGSRSTRDRAQAKIDRQRERDAATYAMAIAKAHATIEKFSGQHLVDVVGGPRAERARTAVRIARSRTHPDRSPGRTSRDFLRVQNAAELLSQHYGVPL